ncbi:hypothetical protein ACTI_48560 [Actinoplanes sp. OR16]|uniref:PH domain-containing protein n=1 Tax=Actinoplanes sp. OR16 TaxID=946334 RepID=UPI000F6C3039|nr:PH domain-containing protein [Actinoplanes sp. OR16]BBH68171.1 hypothetical protein ACTI_48560 [Actinoplanes sp. OR16]
MSQTWGVTPAGKISTVAGGVVVTGYGFAVAGPVFGTVVLVVSALAIWLTAIRPSVTLTGDELIVRNPWGTTTVPLTDVKGFGGAYAGLSIERHSGGSVAAWAVQKSNAAKWSGKRTRADEVTDAIRQAAGMAGRRS